VHNCRLYEKAKLMPASDARIKTHRASRDTYYRNPYSMHTHRHSMHTHRHSMHTHRHSMHTHQHNFHTPTLGCCRLGPSVPLSACLAGCRPHCRIVVVVVKVSSLLRYRRYGIVIMYYVLLQHKVLRTYLSITISLSKDSVAHNTGLCHSRTPGSTTKVPTVPYPTR
jgi:hypothetical protein